jgi:hypothetical protein
LHFFTPGELVFCHNARPGTISDDFAGMGYWQRLDLLSAARYEVLKPIEAVAMTGTEWEKGESFIADLARTGEVVFAA